MPKNLHSIINHFNGMNVLVIGDAMLDAYLYGAENKANDETPVSQIEVEEVNLIPGGAANTAVNLIELGADVDFVSVVGCDYEAEMLKDALIRRGLNISEMMCDSSRLTLTKQQILSEGRLLARYDSGTKQVIAKRHERQIINLLMERYHHVDAVVVTDFGCGTVTDKVITTIKKLQDQREQILVVDTKEINKYKDVGMTVVKPDYFDLTSLIPVTNLAPCGARINQLRGYQDELLRATNAKCMTIAIASEGALMVQKGKESHRTYSRSAGMVRAAGASDTYVSALALSLASGALIEDAADIAQAAMAAALHKPEAATCSRDELMQYLGEAEAKSYKWMKNYVSTGPLASRTKES